MTANLAFWCGALVLLGGSIALAGVGWRSIRRGAVDQHRRLMNASALMIVLFLVAYAIKVWVLGKEQLSTWSAESLLVLHVHETLIAVMLVTGAWSRILARRFRHLDSGSGDSRIGARPNRSIRVHRWLGRTAVVSGVLGVVTAAMILVGMFQRHLG